METSINETISNNPLRTKIHKDLQSLLKRCREVLESKYGSGASSLDTRKNIVCPEHQLLNYYQRLCSLDNSEIYMPGFTKLYNDYHDSFVAIREDDEWLRNPLIVVKFDTAIGEKASKKTSRYSLTLGTFYKWACEKRMEVLNVQPRNSEQNDTYLRPVGILLHLYRIFYYIHSDKNKEESGIIVDHLEKVLGVSQRTVTMKATPLRRVLGALNGVMSKLGMNIPQKGLDNLNEEYLVDSIVQIMEDPVIGEAVGAAISSVKKMTFEDIIPADATGTTILQSLTTPPTDDSAPNNKLATVISGIVNNLSEVVSRPEFSSVKTAMDNNDAFNSLIDNIKGGTLSEPPQLENSVPEKSE